MDAMNFSLEQLRELCLLPTFVVRRIGGAISEPEAAAWVRAHSNVKANPNGITGWAKLSGQAEIRIHVCACSPCKADYPASKYGVFGPPVHCEWLPHAPVPCNIPLDTVVAASSASLSASAAPTSTAITEDSSNDASPITEQFVCHCSGETGDGNKTVDLSDEGQTGYQPAVADAGLPPTESRMPQYRPPDIPVTAPLPVDESDPAVEFQPPATAALPTASILLPVPSQGSVLDDSNSPLAKMMSLAREIRKPRAYVGYAAFLLLALKKRCHVFIWEGSHRVNLLEVFAPWAVDSCLNMLTVDAILCKYTPGHHCKQVSDDCPIDNCNHYVAGLSIDHQHGEILRSESSFEAFYLNCNLAVVYTIADGDCGLDVMCLMCGLEREAHTRNLLRQELSNFLIFNAAHAALQESIFATQEFQENGNVPGSSQAVAANGNNLQESISAFAEPPGILSEPPQTFLQPEQSRPDVPNIRSFTEVELAAVKWASGLKDSDPDTLLAICMALPATVVAEQVVRYNARSESLELALLQSRPVVEKTDKRVYRLSDVNERKEAANDFVDYLRSQSIDVLKTKQSLPYGMFAKYLNARPTLKESLKNRAAKARYRKWLKRGLDAVASLKQLATGQQRNLSRHKASHIFVRDRKRRKKLGSYGVHRIKAGCIRENLFEWFSSIRHSVKARFPSQLLTLKAKQYVEEYISACLINGVKPNPPKINSHWMARWRHEFSVCLRKPNRKYKVPKKVLEDRLLIFWTNIARIRQLAVSILGYDLDVINMDQSPFHMNEAGFQLSIFIVVVLK